MYYGLDEAEMDAAEEFSERVSELTQRFPFFGEKRAREIALLEIQERANARLDDY